MKLKNLVQKSLFIFLGILYFSGNNPSGKIQYFGVPTLVAPVADTRYFILDFKDDIANDTLWQQISAEGYPLRYTRPIRTGVCFDNKCRPLDVTIHWNPTGRYLGFELPEKEFLSKYDHEPFTAEEYEQLHALLTDQFSPLGSFHYNEIVPQADSTYDKVDAVSGATSANVLEYVVEGAAFTTYKLWNITYGSSQQHVQQLTEKALTPALVQLLLESPDMQDKLWALNHINGFITPDATLRQTLLTYISEKEFTLAERAIKSLNSRDLTDKTLQLEFTKKIFPASYSLKKLLLQKLQEAPALQPEVVQLLRKNLSSFTGESLTTLLDLWAHHAIFDSETRTAVEQLRQHSNPFIAKKAEIFLQKSTRPTTQK
ncbi:hypothetical protein [Arundinibacter roseus]|uniref:Uncharacterized protein n=1 Tax=Arundinibacter roseus TaxID=2070510 RepID=A0A4R4K6L5_9BACT|nr:hypothetical protein [Arundinibacter roseus]TDB62332.1 hypothetical protein EZE20_18290 [Arundinibacter roseus]